MANGIYKLDEIMPLAKMVQGWINDLGGRSLICGPFRRGCEVVGEVGIVTTIQAHIVAGHIANVCKAAGTPCTIITNLDIKKNKGVGVDMIIDDVQFSLYGALEEYWGAMTLYLTGSKLFNILMRGEAKKQGYKLSQYGLFHLEEMVAGKTEEQIFAALGLPYMIPAERNLIGNGRLKEAK